jgi:tetratricopeptide (TPR) repeat protein
MLTLPRVLLLAGLGIAAFAAFVALAPPTLTAAHPRPNLQTAGRISTRTSAIRAPEHPPVDQAAQTTAGATLAGDAVRTKANAMRPLSPLVARLTQLENGPGILVCEPMGRGADAATVDFGAGCARWLHLIVGGHGELGKTPTWTCVLNAQRELKKHDLRLSLEQAASLHRILGITHVALGEIRGDANHCRLTYRCWQIPEKRAVGKPITVSGTRAELLAHLPRLAAALARTLGVTAPRVPPGVGETADELQTLGSLPWAPEDLYLSDAQVELLERLMRSHGAISSPDPSWHPAFLASFLDLIYRGSLWRWTGVLGLGRRLTTLLPENALVWGQWTREAHWVHYRSGEEFPGGVEIPLKALSPNVARFPNNYLYRMAESYFQQIGGRASEGRSLAEHAARCAARNPETWLFLGDSIFDQADAVRHGRVVRDLTPEQLQYCSQRYAEEVPVALHAVHLDPRSVTGWLKVSTVAAFASDDELADGAYERALELDPGYLPAYRWGLELYQPKWLNDREKLAGVVRKAVEAGSQWNSASRLEIACNANVIADQIRQTRLAELAQPLVRTDQERKELQASLDQYRRECAALH